MSKHIQLHIPEPCHENWNKMTPVEIGRFCGSCQKQVVDFTNMKDEQLIAFFKRQSTGSVCGRFMQDQLDRSMEIPRKRIPWVRYFFQFALPAFLLSKKASAQGQVRILTGDTVAMQVAPKIKPVKRTVNEYEKERIIRGRVVDEVGEGISYATIFIKGTTIGAAADSAGGFSLKYSGQDSSIVLVSSCIGFMEVETVVDLNKMEGSITTYLSSNNTLREVIVVAYPGTSCRFLYMGAVASITTRTSFMDTVWNRVFPAKQFSKVYPNPVKSNAQLTIEISKPKKGSYKFQLSAVNGQIILSKELWIDENNRVVKINIPPVAAGTYFVQMINKQSGKQTTEKIVVE